ncbi:transcription-repair coupling factor [Inquilinus sp. NPDC058860]|uniref:transcription-repair coupling factor n=1 Tax=Inquilinus sp. NPDC058860 TaxID=3346652 RepID=UPI0036AAAF41
MSALAEPVATRALARHRTIGGVPQGQDARLIAELARKAGDKGLLHVASDDARLPALEAALAFFAPDLAVVVLPPWDCLPYDRVSPNPETVAERVDALTRLLLPREPGRAFVVLTTIGAAMQRVPPRDAFAEASLSVAPGQRVDLEGLQAFLARNGYVRAQTVREPGEFAVRGGIVDLFPPGTEEPLRLDLFGDELEKIRRFDPMSQRTTGEVERITLKPMGEVFLDSASIARFRSGYRELFGAINDDDPLYEAVSAGRKQAGMEHWLPLFHDHLDTVFDYLPDASVTLDHQLEQARDQRLAQIADFYEARLTHQAAQKKAKGVPYRPIPPDRLYLDVAEWDTCLAGRPVADFSPFAPPEGGTDAGGRRGHDFAEARANPEVNLYAAVRNHIGELKTAGKRVLIAGYTPGARDRLRSMLSEQGRADFAVAESWAGVEKTNPASAVMVVLPLEHGFAAPDLAVITEQDILGDRLTRPQKKRRKSEQFIAEVSALAAGDIVVHQDHGIGRYEGLETLTVGGAAHDCLRIVYDGGDKLFVPVENIEVLSRYGSGDMAVQLDKLGGAGWQARKARVKKRLKDMAEELMRIAAARALRTTASLPPPEGLYEEFAARFPYAETEDQQRAIDEVLDDLQAGRPMDRLVCGDVGFGKTEVALRAAFAAAANGVQVAVVVPTTLLARQHFRTFSERFKGLPLRVAQLSRMVTPKDAKLVRDELAAGTMDIVVGTHAILSKQVSFKNLGLVIVDEEQHFGVKQKEKLKALREDVHVLTLTATPIPRTLQMSLSGVRELSLITTPPIDRLAVRTFVLPFDPVIIREAVLREHFRGGQTYYVCPRIEDLGEAHQTLLELVPEVKIAVAHGQMPATQLEEVMSAFYDGQFDVLLATAIVESGLDVPSANTMVIHRADLFGLAQLYQLRGRIGRSKLRGYAYLTYAPRKALSKTAQQRLHVIETLDTLGAGFTLASHDMDIRGAGNLLGEEQSGHIREVGAELYQQMLDEAVRAARAGISAVEDLVESWTPQINLGVPVLIPEEYVADLQVRLDLYRRISALEGQAELDGFAAELIDRFGALPEEVENLLELVAIKRLCRAAGVERLDAGPKGAVIGFRDNRFARPDKLIGFIQRMAGAIKVRPDQKLVYARGWETPQDRVGGARKLVQRLADLAG